jgi:hypothetical protein
LWRTFGTQRGTTIKILQLLINILEKNPREDTKEMAFQPVAVSARQERDWELQGSAEDQRAWSEGPSRHWGRSRWRGLTLELLILYFGLAL